MARDITREEGTVWWQCVTFYRAERFEVVAEQLVNYHYLNKILSPEQIDSITCANKTKLLELLTTSMYHNLHSMLLLKDKSRPNSPPIFIGNVHLTSVYNHRPTGEPPFTCVTRHFKGNNDQIWKTPHFNIKSILEIGDHYPPQLPSTVDPSDHIMLMADLIL
ncbi:hypothetical protein SAMD00019534_078510 [Acytostelium subglobosum LB1]|uniref:hypothetical protein n=1 Tax=Acytostelium subglobosum LB1 TaxID=1410327 RepID=UPI000644889B|nr:hypothetical protein SAMD00019534_078510 [Acytostelium subglobosum LB1]GAM24676.1 hypothetical protein SAMD00019534_078510 [Acytostelium subglobosum LB1]|eukprot:XP_012752345.1 hypothetical protein SAMD00019534_078510 [Acytostelium subglobosum LB1]